jgi:hypothetical protein
MQGSITIRSCGLSLPARHNRKVTAAVAKPSSAQSNSSSEAVPWLLRASVAAAPLLAAAPAYAKGGELGILEGRSIALIHPAVMGFLFVYTCYAGWLGFQVCRFLASLADRQKPCGQRQLQHTNNKYIAKRLQQLGNDHACC